LVGVWPHREGELRRQHTWARLSSAAFDTADFEHADIGICVPVARAATTADAFNAVAEPRRREILDVLAGGERSVNDLVRLLGLPQPQVSKHLRVLREVGVVDVRDQGRQRFYRLNGHALKPIHDWVKNYERSWSERFDQLDVMLEELRQQQEEDDADSNEWPGDDGDAPHR
jgi:DNA-binding transcriptional ArsR family regulator